MAGNGPDPWMAWHDGFYYLTYTRGRDLAVRRAPHIGDLRAADDHVVWRDPDPSRNKQVYASEFHLMDGPNGRRWYFYYCASDGVDDHHRVYVLEADSVGGTPLGPYHFKAKLATDPDGKLYALDPDVFTLPDGRPFLVWAGNPRHVLFVQQMSDPWTTTGRRTQVAASGFGCPNIREGPEVLVRDGRVYLFYSACDTGEPNYKVGLLIANATDDLLDPKAVGAAPRPGAGPQRPPRRVRPRPQRVLHLAGRDRGLDRLPRQDGGHVHVRPPDAAGAADVVGGRPAGDRRAVTVGRGRAGAERGSGVSRELGVVSWER